MITGMIIGFGIGITVTTVMWSIMLIKGTTQRKENNKLIEALLVRKAEGIERIASILEDNSNDTDEARKTTGD